MAALVAAHRGKEIQLRPALLARLRILEKSADNALLARDLATLISDLCPGVVYTHNPADKHETHLAVFSATLKAIRSLPREKRPGKLLGYEGWRGLDWVIDSEKTILDVSRREHLFSALAGAAYRRRRRSRSSPA